jgi:hypothetical protein
LLKALSEVAIVAYAPRRRFASIAEIRRATKTPPGFEDAGHGDFFIWADSLLGLLEARDIGKAFSSFHLVTDDRKKDWCKGKVAHPILCAEASKLLGVDLYVTTLEELSHAIEDRLRAGAASVEQAKT